MSPACNPASASLAGSALPDAARPHMLAMIEASIARAQPAPGAPDALLSALCLEFCTLERRQAALYPGGEAARRRGGDCGR